MGRKLVAGRLCKIAFAAPRSGLSSPRKMSVFIKICGLANAADVAAVVALKPDALGFVLWPKSPRAVRPEQVAEWTRDLPPGLLKVGVVVDETAAEIRRAAEIARLAFEGMNPEEAAQALRTVAKGNPKMCATLVTCDPATGRASAIQRIMLGE